MKKIFSRILPFLIIILFNSKSYSQQSTEFPPELAPWVDWISAGRPEWKCAVSNKTYECLWPGSITYVVSAKGAKFTVKAEVLAESRLEIPSTPELYPSSLEVRGESGQVIYPAIENNKGKLEVKVPNGNYTVSGAFHWEEVPDELPLPANYGLIDVKFEGLDESKLAYSRLEGAIRFHDKEKAGTTSSVSLKVFRKLKDSSPLIIDSLLKIKISGGARSYQIGKFLPKNSFLTSISSSLPYQIGADGGLTLQLLPGNYDLYFTSVLAQPVSVIELPEFNPDVWPQHEIWSWNADTIFRSVEVSNARPIDASLTELPPDWRTSETYQVANGASVNLKELRRGKEKKPFSKLNLSRSMWIDLDGKGYTVSDYFYGELQQVSRLNAQKQTTLGRATLNDSQQLITVDPTNNLVGVEIRDTQVNLNAVSRIERERTFPAIGWETGVESLNINLNLPPSWMLLGTLNTSSAGSWFESWSLFEVFILILIIIATYKIFGFKLALLVGLAGVLNYREFLAPNLLIIHIIVLEVCRRLVKDKQSFFYKLFNWLLISTFALWSLASLTFMKLQFTQLLFPQLQSGTRYRTALQELLLTLENSLFSWPFLLVILAVTAYGIHKFFAVKGVLKKLVTLFVYGVALFILLPVFFSSVLFYHYESSSGYRPQAAKSRSYLNEMRSYDKEEKLLSLPASIEQSQNDNSTRVFQSGPATPDWKWKAHTISVAGPVSAGHTISIILLPPEVTRIFSALRCLVAILLIYFLLKALSFRVSLKGISPAATAAMLLVVMAPSVTYAEIPPKEILQEMENRLQKKICDTESCALIRELKIDLEASALKLFFDVTSNGASSIKVPGPVSTFNIRKVVLNGRETFALKSSSEHFLEVKTLDGNNRIEVYGDLPNSTSFALELIDYPLHTKVNAPGWYVDGVSPGGQIERGLHFAKEENGSSNTVSPSEVKSAFNSWVIARRNFNIGESVYINTSLERIGDTSAPLRVELPLLQGEIVTNKDAAREADKLIVYIPAGENGYIVTSQLNTPEELVLKNRKTSSLSEEWVITCESFISCAFDGLLPTSTNSGTKQQYSWHPFPDEEVKVKIKSLSIAAGEYLTIDKVYHTVRWGTNRRAGNLQISLRATKQLTFDIKFSENDSIENVLVNNVQGAGKLSGSSTSVLLSPGNHNININYAKEWEAGFRENVPVFTASSDLHNINITVNPSAERWVVWTGGGFWGPSVVFWAKIIVMVLLIYVMVRIGLLDLSLLSTLLLGLGLSTLPIVFLCVPLAWLVTLKFLPLYHNKFLIDWRIPKAIVFWLLSLLSLVIFYNLVRTGLVLSPPMLIVGNNSNFDSLRWFFDHAGKDSPSPYVLSFPLWYWRVIALAWSGWFVFMLFEWLKQMVEVGREVIKR